jgi:inner membrane protein
VDNITHTLTGALAARFVRTRGEGPESGRRTLFWLFLVSANLPDIDVAARLFTDPITALGYHRGITHSFVFAPLFGLLPAVLFYAFGRVKRFTLLWLCAWMGISVHIFFDLITPFGTQVFLPLSARRFSLDWMFIIDPLFTILMGAGLWAGRRWSGKRFARWAAISFVVAYLLLEAVCHRVAEARVEAYALRNGLTPGRISALPQPLNVFRWMGIVQTDRAVEQIYFSLLDDTVASESFPQSRSPLTHQTMEMYEARWYLSYARHPWVHEELSGDTAVVEFRDMQFSVDPSLALLFGVRDRNVPFVLRYVYAPPGELSEVQFDRSVIRRVARADSGK